MRYEQVKSSESAGVYVKNFWWVDSEGDDTAIRQKIIPDGFPELIFHYGDAYKINISGNWERQHNFLLAGQIRNHFFLENTGKTGMIGIKMQPTAIYELFGIDMSGLVDKVVPVNDQGSTHLYSLMSGLTDNFEQTVAYVERWIADFTNKKTIELSAVDSVVKLILKTKGNLKMAGFKPIIETTNRQLERQFKKCVGLSPKFYSRIVRFTHIFDQIKQGKNHWAHISLETGYYDQAHFIKNFTEFTGENPTSYGFNDENMANFFLFNG